MVTLLLVYSIGLGNIAVTSEKFGNPWACQAYKERVVAVLKDSVISAECVG